MNTTDRAGVAKEGRPETFGSAYDTRRNNFDCLRFMLASLVIWSHCFPLSGRSMDWFYAVSGQIDGGSLAVDGFFIASGFLVAQSWYNSPSAAVFARKRLLRIVPAMLAALAFGALIIGPLNAAVELPAYFGSSDPWRHFMGVMLNRYLYMETVFTSNPMPHVVNAPLWSLRYEIMCYAVVPLLAHRCFKNSRAPIILVFLASSLWVAVAPVGSGDAVMRVAQTAARLFACFSAGMLFFIYRDRVPYRGAWAAAAALILVVTLLVGGFSKVFPLAGGYLLLCAAFSPALPFSRFGRYGDFSYGLYVFAYPLQQSIVHLLGPGVPVSLFFALSFGAALGLAFLSWRLLEAPALAFKPKSTASARPAMARAPAPRGCRDLHWFPADGSKVQVKGCE